MTSLSITRRGALIAGLGASAAACATTPDAGSARFTHGVASGDPTPDRVVLWTRAAPARPETASVPLRWVVAEDASLKSVVAQGETTADAARDYCAKVDVSGLQPGRRYHYGFFAGEVASPVGRTRTLSLGKLDQVKLAVFSCSNYPFGRFHAYADLAARPDVDFAMHIGDYIYEYGGPKSWGEEEGQANGRAHQPPHEIITLDDYRTRYRQYRSDPDLQAAHAAVPWILAWDDHEICNNPWMHGAENHNPDKGEGTWEDRERNAIEAYFEWMPIREPEAGRIRYSIWRRFDFGDLATLAVLETRLTGRDEQLDYRTDLPWIETAYKADENGRMQIVPPDQLIPTPPPGVERLRTAFDMRGPKPIAVRNYARAKALSDKAGPDGKGLPEGYAFRRDVDAFREKLNDPDRHMIAPDQEAWLLGLAADAEKRGAWQLVGTQTVFARQDLFDFAHYYDAPTIAKLQGNRSHARTLERGRLGLPDDLDDWDGYPAQRDRIADAFSSAKAHVVLLSGDSHAFWANEIFDKKGHRAAVEFGGTAVSSPGYPEWEGLNPPLADVYAKAMPAVRFADLMTRGYLLVSVKPDEIVCDMIGTASPSEPEPKAFVLKRWVQKRRDNRGMLPALEERKA
jgi:alkaline phosphatase D